MGYNIHVLNGNEPNMKKISVHYRLDEDLHKRVKDYAASLNERSATWVVTQALTEYLNKWEVIDAHKHTGERNNDVR